MTSSSAQSSASAKALSQHIDKRSTGRLTVGAGASELSAYLMSGNVVACQGHDDQRAMLDMLRRRGGLSPAVAGGLESVLEQGGDVFGDMLDLAPDHIDGILEARFRDNLAKLIGSLSKPSFEKLPTVLVNNIQMGHDSHALIEELALLWDRSSSLDVDTQITTGSTSPTEPIHEAVVATVNAAPRTVSAVLHELPLEEVEARALILDLLAADMLAIPGEDSDEPGPTETVNRDLVEADTLIGGAPGAAPGDDDQDSQDDSSDVSPKPMSSSHMPNTLDQWLEQASAVDDDELDFFADHDGDRGSLQEGAFTTETHNLDKVEVVSMGEQTIEAPESPVTRFGAPVLSEDEAFGKVGVANEALTVIVDAFDDAQGAGRGQAVLQLLVDGSPGKYANLLRDLTVDNGGPLPASDLVDNLYSRPASEHRQLLNKSLEDLIDRALSSAADELPDEIFDDMYGQVAGYRKRLGL